MVDIQTLLFLYMAVGYLCRKLRLFREEATTTLTDFSLYIALPCMVFQSFRMEFSAEVLKRGTSALIVAFAGAICALILGKLLFGRMHPDKGRIMQYGTLVSNAGFAGLPVAEAGYGTEGLLIGSIYIIPTRILMWSAGISLFTDAPLKERLRRVMLNPGIIAVILGLIRMVTQIVIPARIDQALTTLGNCTTPVAMIVVGMILADTDMKEVPELSVLVLILVRQILLPFLTLFMLRLVPVDETVRGIAVLITGMPIGSTTTLLAAKYGANTSFSSKCVFFSTLTSLITVPLLALFL